MLARAIDGRKGKGRLSIVVGVGRRFIGFSLRLPRAERADGAEAQAPVPLSTINAIVAVTAGATKSLA